jgi:hypothetical protein
MYGATGWLYGLGHEGIPSDNMLSALKPQITAQKAPGGLQHPGANALEVAPMFFRNGGKQVQIYMQDYFPNWPYPDEFETYKNKVAPEIVNKIISSPYRDKFVYIPFNEPDWIWYGLGEAERKRFFNDWKEIYEVIKSLDADAKVGGPNISFYEPTFMEEFLVFCKENNCLPDIIT